MSNSSTYAMTAGLNPTTAVANKWIGYVPFKTVLGDAFQNLELQLTQFYLPAINVNSAPVAFQGYTIKIPAGGVLNAGDKTLKFQYIIDDEWRNYTALHTWASKFVMYGDTLDKATQSAQLAQLAGNFATVRLWLLSPFKKRIVDFEFHNCWVQEFGEILLDCASSEPVKHQFTVQYTHFNIVSPTDTQSNLVSETAEG